MGTVNRTQGMQGRQPCRTLVLLLCSLAAVTNAPAETYFLGVDVPAELAGTDYLPHQIVRSQLAVYSLELALPQGTDIAALDLRPDGSWLFAPAHPVTLDGSDYEPRDLVAVDGGTYSLELDGSAAGVPAGARIDALFFDPAGRPVLSFDVPVDLGGTLYGPSDLVLYDGGFSAYWFGNRAGVPGYANVVGAAENAGGLVLTFDVPTELGGTLYEPGELVDYSFGAFGSRFKDAAWPPYAQLRGFSFGPSSGAVPDGGSVPGSPLEIAKAAGGDITLRWDVSCSSSDSDYAVYEGVIGSFTSHDVKLCSTGGATQATITPGPRSSYYLVVPQNALREGSYGTDSAGSQRPQGPGSCQPQEIGICQ